MDILTMLLGFVMIVVVYGGSNYYIGIRLFRWLKLLWPRLNGKLFIVLFSLLALTMILAFMPLPAVLSDVFHWLSAYWMGVYVYLLLFFALADVVLVLLKLTKVIAKPLSKQVQFYHGLTVVVLTVVVVGYGIFNATQIKEVSYDIKTSAETNKTGMKIVMVSDLHLGAVNSETRIEEMVEKINAQKPDIVALAGDIFNDDFNDIKDPQKAIELLSNIEATYGVYGSLGNHDGGITLNKMVDFLGQSNIQLLSDDYVVIDERLVLIGRLDPSPIGGFGEWERSDISHLFDEFDASLPVVVIDHTPSNLEQYGEEVDLVMSGHTHRGQIFPGSLFTNALFEVDYGQYQRDANNPNVVVSSGVGTWGMPMRVGTFNEVVTIQLD